MAAFHELEADAITLSPYLGSDAVQPFLQVAGRRLFVLCHTSNPSADEFQTLEVNGRPLYEVVAQRATQWSERVGLVVGATYPHAIATVREVAPDAWLLLPGVGTQGADETPGPGRRAPPHDRARQPQPARGAGAARGGPHAARQAEPRARLGRSGRSGALRPSSSGWPRP